MLLANPQIELVARSTDGSIIDTSANIYETYKTSIQEYKSRLKHTADPEEKLVYGRIIATLQSDLQKFANTEGLGKYPLFHERRRAGDPPVQPAQGLLLLRHQRPQTAAPKHLAAQTGQKPPRCLL